MNTNKEKQLLVKSLEKAREITREIVNYGVNDTEIKQIIKLLSLELEDTETMKKLNNLVSIDILENESTKDDTKKLILWKVIKMEDQTYETPTSYEEYYQHLRVITESLEADILKAQGGNKSAANRARKSLRTMKKFCSEFVKFSLESSK